jgi:hypothetical protein
VQFTRKEHNTQRLLYGHCKFKDNTLCNAQHD